MKYSPLVKRIGGKSVDGWAVHYEALLRKDAGEDIIVLSVGQESGETTPTIIVDAAVQSLRQGRHHYTPVNGEPQLLQALAERHTARTGQPTEPENCTVFAGAQNALFAVAQCLLEGGDEVILLEPFYTTYPATFTASGATAVAVVTRPEQGFRPEMAAIRRAITANTRAIVINSPNNPTGAIYPRSFLRELLELCLHNRIWLISDEVYADLAAPGAHTSACSLADAETVCVTVGSLSKSHRMTGWRVGWVIAPRPLAGHLCNLATCMCYGLPPFTQDAALAALRDCPDIAGEIGNNMARRAAIVVEAVAELPPLRIHSAGSGMFVLLDIRGLDVTSDHFAKAFLRKYDVAMLPCDGFGESVTGLLRVSLCESENRLATACERLQTFVRERGWQ